MTRELDVPAEDVELTRETVVAMLRPYDDAREQESGWRKTKEQLAGPIKTFLEREGGSVFDGEHNLEAHLQDRSAGAKPCDLNAIYDGARPLFEQLLRNGCLRLDSEAVKRAGALVGGIEVYMGPQPRTTALIVEKR